MLEYQGKQYARVTEILSSFSDFSHIDPAILKNKQEIGTRVHDAIDSTILKDFPLLDKDTMGYYKSWRHWMDAIKPKIVLSEKRFYSDRYMITGKPDGLFEIGKHSVIVDYKTSAVESPITWPMQAHLYNLLLREAGYKVADHFLFLKLDKKGAFPKVFTYKYDENIMAKCLCEIEKFWLNH
jgi:hypothetical protein